VNQPLAWIDITAKDAARSRKFYGVLFDWNIDVNESMNYGLVKPTAEHLPGGIGQASDENPHPPGLVTHLRSPRRRDGPRASRAARWHDRGADLGDPRTGEDGRVHDPDGNRVGLWEV